VQQPQDENVKSYEVGACEWLINFFRSLLGPEEKKVDPLAASKSAEEKRTSKVDEDIKKGILKEINHEEIEAEDIIGISKHSTIRAKHGKVSKLGKKAEKETKTNILNLDISIIKQIKDIKLTPPSYKNDVPGFLNLLNTRLNELKGVSSGPQSGQSPKKPQVEVKTQSPVKQASPEKQALPQKQAEKNASPEKKVSPEKNTSPEKKN